MKQQERTELTRQRLMDAAMASFAEKGYEGSTVALICERADVSKGAFYHHFDSKQAIFLALMQRWLSGLDAQMAQLRGSMRSVPDGLRSMSSIFSDVLQDGNEQLPMYLEFWVRAMRDPQVWRASIEPFERYRAFFETMLIAGMRDGSVRNMAGDHAARVLVAFAVGMLMQGLLEPAGVDWEEALGVGMDVLMNGLVEERSS